MEPVNACEPAVVFIPNRNRIGGGTLYHMRTERAFFCSSCDVVFHNNWNTMESRTFLSVSSLRIKRSGLLDRSGIRFDDGSESWALQIDLVNARKVSLMNESVLKSDGRTGLRRT